MKDIKKLREEYDVLTESAGNEEKRLVALIRAGLLDATKLPLLKRALSKEVKILTPAERNIMIELLNSLMAQVLNSNPIYTRMRQNVMMEGSLEPKETKSARTLNMASMPSIIVLKRRAIRVYPGGQNVGLYYSQQLDRYVAVPFGDERSVLNMNEETEQLDEISNAKATEVYSKRRYASETHPNKFERLKSAAKASKDIQRRAKKGGEIHAINMEKSASSYIKAMKDTGQSSRRVVKSSSPKTNSTSSPQSPSAPKTTVDKEAIKKRLAAKHQEKMTNLLAKRYYNANKSDSEDRYYQQHKAGQTLKRLSKKLGREKAKGMEKSAKKKAEPSLKKYDQYRSDAGSGSLVKDMRSGDTFGQAAGRWIYRKTHDAPKGPPLEEDLRAIASSALGALKKGATSALGAGKEFLNSKTKNRNRGRNPNDKRYLPDVSDRQSQLRVRQHGVDTDRRRRIDRSYVDPRDKLQENVEVDLGGTTFQLPSAVANKIVSVYQSLNEGNQTKMIEKMQESNESLNKVIAFAIRQ